jgi:hypothetical protein
MKKTAIFTLSHLAVGLVCFSIGCAFGYRTYLNGEYEYWQNLRASHDEPKVDVLCAGVDIPAGTRIQQTMLGRSTKLKKQLDPEGLILAKDFTSVIGRTAALPIRKTQEIKLSDLVILEPNPQHQPAPYPEPRDSAAQER